MIINGSKLSGVLKQSDGTSVGSASDINQANSNVITNNRNIIVSYLSDMIEEINGSKFVNTPFEGKGSGKYIGLDIDTGESDITTVKLSIDGSTSTALTLADSNYATLCELDTGHFVYIIDPTQHEEQILVFSKEGKENTTIIIQCVDTTE